MKQLIPISLIFLLTWQTMFNAGFILYWKVNQTLIAKTLCVNRNKPQMHCNGKCYLYKQLKKAEEEENAKNSLPNAIPKFKLVDHFIAQNQDLKIVFTLFSIQKLQFSDYSSNLLMGCENSIFRPPKFI